MSDDKVEAGAHRNVGAKTGPGGQAPQPGDGDGNTADREPQVEGGQPAVGDGLPRNTEF